MAESVETKRARLEQTYSRKEDIEQEWCLIQEGSSSRRTSSCRKREQVKEHQQ
jgi:hypothetical protein